MEDHAIPIGLLHRLAVGDASKEEIDLTLAWLQADGLVRPPRSVVRRALSIPGQSRPSVFRRLIGAFVPVAPALAGTRGPLAGQVLTYVTSGLEVEVEVAPSGAAQVMTGQVVGDDDWTVARLETDAGDLETEIDAMGMFTFPPAHTLQTLIILGESAEVRLDLPESSP